MNINRASPALVSLEGLPSIRLEPSILLIGRSSECDVVVDSKKVSRKHCAVALLSDECVAVKDLGSTNGVRVNGQRRLEGRLLDGDEIAIADMHYRFQRFPNAAAPPMPNGHGATAPKAPVQAVRATDSMIERCDLPIPLLEDEPVGADSR